MAVGRIFPLRSPHRTFPFEPSVPGETDRTAPLPFQIGAGASANVDTTLVLAILLQSAVSQFVDPGGGGGGGTTTTTCTPNVNLFCVPTAVLTIADRPVATVRCAIT